MTNEYINKRWNVNRTREIPCFNCERNKQQAGACLYQEKKNGEADDNISVLRFLLSEFLPGFAKEKDQDRKELQSAGQHIKSKDQLGQRRKDPEVSGRTDQRKTGTYIV